MADILTISKFLKGSVRGITPSDEAIQTICASAGVDPELSYSEALLRELGVRMNPTLIGRAVRRGSSTQPICS